MEENQEVILRSVNNRHQSFVRFVNKTLENVTLYWIDYQGRAVNYGDLSPNDHMDIDTFVTHPWIFVDKATKDRYVVNHSDVFFPKLPRTIERTRVYITLPVYTLRQLSLRAIRACLRHDRQALQLDIPRSLQYELAKMLPKKEEGTIHRNNGNSPNP